MPSCNASTQETEAETEASLHYTARPCLRNKTKLMCTHTHPHTLEHPPHTAWHEMRLFSFTAFAHFKDVCTLKQHYRCFYFCVCVCVCCVHVCFFMSEYKNVRTCAGKPMVDIGVFIVLWHMLLSIRRPNPWWVRTTGIEGGLPCQVTLHEFWEPGFQDSQ